VEDPDALRDGLPTDVRAALDALGKKSPAAKLRHAIILLCELRWWTAKDLSLLLRRKDPFYLAERYLAPMVREGTLERRYPENLTHPQQSYRARQMRGDGL
jgi:hypothetical protein